jgi:hypothetical protein
VVLLGADVGGVVACYISGNKRLLIDLSGERPSRRCWLNMENGKLCRRGSGIY